MASVLSPRSRASLNSIEMDASKGPTTADAERLLSDIVSGLGSSTKSPAHGTGPSSANKGPWTKEEDEMLIRLVNEYGTKQWSVVASHLKVRLRLRTPSLAAEIRCAANPRKSTGSDRQAVPRTLDQQLGSNH
jgi:hypothetical protein